MSLARAVFFACTLLVACTISPPAPGPGDASGALDLDYGGDIALSVQWRTTPGTYPATGLLVATITNRRQGQLEPSLALVGRGLGDREARRALGLVRIQPGEPFVVTVPIGELPVQSVGTQSATTLAVSFSDRGETHTIESMPLLHEFVDSRFAELRVFDEYGKPLLTESLESFFGTDPSGTLNVTTAKLGELYAALAEAGTKLEGRVWDDAAQAWVAVKRLRENFVGETRVATGRLAQIIDHVATGGIAGSPAGGGGGGGGGGPPPLPTTSCVRWRVGWVDEGYSSMLTGGVRESVRSASGTFAARYAHIALHPMGNPMPPIFSDYLGSLGCTVLPENLPPGPFTLILSSRMRRGTTDAVVYERQCFESDLGSDCKCTPPPQPPPIWLLDGNPVHTVFFPTVYVTSVFVSKGGFVATIIPTFEALAGDVAAAYGQALSAPNGGLLDGQTYRAFANQPCPSVDTSTYQPGRCLEACSAGEETFYSHEYLGPNTKVKDLANHNARWKFVVAHEMGHQVQKRQLGGDLFHRSYGINVNRPILCACNGVNPTGNEIHCLQSSEQQGAAQVQGFGHFQGGSIWNVGASTCTFTYYKGFRENALTAFPVPPPYPVSCINPVKWAESHCAIADSATEFDWQGFYNGIARDPDAPIDQLALAQVYLQLCFDQTGKSFCDQNVKSHWQDPQNTGKDLQTAVTKAFSAMDPRLATFLSAGNKHGVTR